MNNVFKDFDVGVRFDLKGSVHGRELLTNEQDIPYHIANDIKTALKDNDWRKHMRNITLDEDGFQNREKFNSIIKKDADFFAVAGIIDYSLLLGEIVLDRQSTDRMRELAKVETDAFNGVYFTDEGSAYVIGIIDPLTGFDFGKRMEYSMKKIYQNGASCVPPDLYALRFKDFMNEAILSKEEG